MRLVFMCLVLWHASVKAQNESESTPPPWQSPSPAVDEPPAAEPPPEEPAPRATPPVPPPPASTSSGTLFFPALRIQLGPAFLFGPMNASSSDFAFDAQAGLRVILRDTPAGIALFDTTAGYTYTGGVLGGNAFTLGGSVLWGNPVAAVGPAAYFILGQMSDHDRFAAGVRLAVRVDFFLGLLGAEVAYEGRFADGLSVHELRLMLASEALAMLLAAAFIR